MQSFRLSPFYSRLILTQIYVSQPSYHFRCHRTDHKSCNQSCHQKYRQISGYAISLNHNSCHYKLSYIVKYTTGHTDSDNTQIRILFQQCHYRKTQQSSGKAI